MQHYFASLVNGSVLLNEQDAFHISNVMRMKVNDEIIVIIDGKHHLAQLTSIKPLNIKLVRELDINNELNRKVILLYPLAKGEKISFIIQKATELGATDIVLYKSERCVVKMDNDDFARKLPRYQLIAKEAAEQSERNLIPNIHGVIDINKIPNEFKSDLNLVAYEELQGHASKIDKDKSSYSLLVGPEGGLSKTEIESLLKQGFKTISLGKRILRVETAAVYFLSILGYSIEL